MISIFLCYYKIMNPINISRAQVKKEAGVVVLPMKEYQRLLAAAVPSYHFSRQDAKKFFNTIHANV